LTLVVALVISWVHERYAMERMRVKLPESMAELKTCAVKYQRIVQKALENDGLGQAAAL
jgi:hypothetical protein